VHCPAEEHKSESPEPTKDSVRGTRKLSMDGEKRGRHDHLKQRNREGKILLNFSEEGFWGGRSERRPSGLLIEGVKKKGLSHSS